MTVMRDLLFPAIERHWDRCAVVVKDQSWTYGDLGSSALRLAGSLARLGVGPGDSVAIALKNSAEYLIADLAIIAIGAAKTPINLMLSDDDLSYILRDSRAKVVIVEHERLGAVQQSRVHGASVTAIVRGGEPSMELNWETAVAGEVMIELPAAREGDRAMLMYTGGTTGRPKGVSHSHAGLVSNLLSHLIETEITAEDRLLLTSPLPHSAGFLAQTALLRGATVYLEDRFDIGVVLDRIEQDRASYLFMVPTMIYRLLDAVESRENFDSSALRTILYGAAPITVDRLKQGLNLLGPVFVQLYGQSEAPNFLTKLHRYDHVIEGDHSERLSSCGQSVTMARVRVVAEDGKDLKPGEVGEVICWAPYVMQGYLGLESETRAALRDGWLFTGDLGYLDERGYLYLVDRKKDMIITGGLNVYSSEVEQGLAKIEGVREVSVIGVPHPVWGEAVVAFVVPSSAEVSTTQIANRSHEVLTSYKRPKEIVLLDRLPVTAVGKIDKKQLRMSWDQ